MVLYHRSAKIKRQPFFHGCRFLFDDDPLILRHSSQPFEQNRLTPAAGKRDKKTGAYQI